MVESKQFLLKIPLDLRAKVKARAAERNITMTLFINQILRREISAIEKREIQRIRNEEN